jgi:NADH-quinone oxidoreductase subunit H
MPGTGGTPWWGALLVPVVLVVFALAAATLDAAVAARLAGGDRSGWAGPLRETGRLLLTQRRTVLLPDALLWRVGGGGVIVAACTASVVIPLGRSFAADLSVGVIWWSAFLALLWVLMHMLGYSANAPFPLVAGYRFLAQAMAYEMPLAISIICAALAAHSLQVGQVVTAQQGLWFGVWMPGAFVIFLLCGMAAAFYGPFASATGADVGGGVLAESSGIDRLLVLGGRYLILASVAGFGTAMFLGGGGGPWLPPAVWSAVKIVALMAVMVAARWRWPRLRMERFQEVAWTVLLPVSIVQALIVALVVL